MINKLLNILEDEIELYRTLLDISGRERDAMVRYSLSDILNCHEERKSIYLKAAHLQENRFAVLVRISNETGIPQENLTLSSIIEITEHHFASALEGCGSTLKELIAALSTADSGNKRIALKSLSFIDQSMKILTGFTAVDPVYLSNGALNKHDNPGCRVRREA